MNRPPIHSNEATGTAHIFTVRGQRVILDSDLAALYGVPTKRLNEKVRRDPGRLPPDFAFLLTREEWQSLKSQLAALQCGRATHRRFAPYVFTEHGALMAAGVVKSRQAIAVSIDLIGTLHAMSNGEWRRPDSHSLR